MMKKTILLLALSLVLVLSQGALAEAGFTAFTAPDLEGNEVDQSIFADYDLTMINIWATFCGPCLNEMPDLGELAAAYAEKGVAIVGIVADVPPKADGSFDPAMVAAVQELVELTGADYLHLLPSADLIAAKLGQVSAVPETIFVDSQGRQVGDSYIGSRSGEAWAAIIDELLEQVKG